MTLASRIFNLSRHTGCMLAEQHAASIQTMPLWRVLSTIKFIYRALPFILFVIQTRAPSTNAVAQSTRPVCRAASQTTRLKRPLDRSRLDARFYIRESLKCLDLRAIVFRHGTI